MQKAPKRRSGYADRFCVGCRAFFAAAALAGLALIGCDRKNETATAGAASDSGTVSQNKDPVAGFKAFKERYRNEVDAVFSADKAWEDDGLRANVKEDVLFTGFDQFDVTRTDSLVSPYQAIVRAALHDGSVTDGKPEFFALSGDVLFTFEYQNGNWILNDATVRNFTDADHEYTKRYDILQDDSKKFRIIGARLRYAALNANRG